jgi:cbb3-type cytochrome oxidase maturation protein
MTLVYIIAFASILGLSAVCALFWAVRTGQLDDFRAGAVSIFDDDEPTGEVTDRFPITDLERGGKGSIH